MSETIATKAMGLGLDLQAVSTPKSQLLKSFNIFKPFNPQELLRKHTRVCAAGEIPQKNVSTSDDGQGFTGTYTEQEYSRDVKKDLAISAGIKGKYGLFSASLQADYSRSEHSTYTSYYSSYAATIAVGTVSFKGDKDILGLLDPDMVTELRAINNLAKAKDFTDKWGTHLITEVSCGGMLFVSIAAKTETKEEKEKLAVKLKAAYGKAMSITAAISAISETSESSKSLTQTVVALGGDSRKAGNIEAKDRATMKDWVDSCNIDTSYTVSESKEIFTLVDGDAQKFLKQYINLAMLAHSLKNPVIFVKEKNIAAYQTNSITAPGINTSDYKIIGGGAAANEGSSSFLNGCYPQVAGNRPTGWHAVSHDMHNPADPNKDVLSAYAIGVYDPEDILEVKVVEQNGTNTRIGGDTATATLADGWVLTCGGLNTTVKTGYGKVVVSSYYTDDHKGWVGQASDYVKAAADTTLTVYAVGIKSKDAALTIEGTYITGPQTRNQHGRNTAASLTPICGGGIKVSENQGMGNLVQRNYPENSTTWKGTNDDLAGNISHANSKAYAISLDAKVKI